ncbi:MAG: transglutaminase domain protein [Vampirovibrio sp.]|nr:transglutaminase domain protein [Vampirovibrio sp.]
MRQHAFTYWVSLSVTVLVTVGAPLSVWAGTDWYMLKTNGKTIGKVSIQNYPNPDAQGGRVTEVRNINHFVRQGNPFEMKTVSRFVEDAANGRPVSFSYRYSLGQQPVLEAQGQMSDDQLDLRLVRENAVSNVQVPISAETFLFPGGEAIQKIYQQHYHDAPGTRFRYQTLNLGVSPEIVDAEVTRLGSEKLALGTGEPRTFHTFQVENPGHRQNKVREWRDAQGKLYKAQSVGAEGMEMVYASRRQVQQADRESLDLIATSAVLSNKIPQPRITTQAIYRISPITGQSIDWSRAIPEGFGQEIMDASLSGLQSAAPEALYLKVTQREPSDASLGYPISQDARYLQSSAFVQSSDPEIDRIAIQAAGKEQRAYYAARLLQQWVYKNIAYKDLSMGFASAKETLLNRQGDCTEHAVLLAALTRALGIPSRVAIGLVYIPNGNSSLGRFVYHMWNEVYIGSHNKGEWVPLDATNPEPMADATHIKMADSALTDVNDLGQLTQQVVGLMGKIKIDVLKAASPAQSTLMVGQQSGVLAVDIPKVDIDQVDIQALSRKAIKHFRVQLPPASMSLDTVDGLFTHGVELLSKGQYESARQAFEKAFTKAHRPVEFYSLGERLAGIEMYGLARQAFQHSIERDTQFRSVVTAWLSDYIPAKTLSDSVNRDFMLAISGSGTENATELLKHVIAKAPQFAPAYRHLGEISTGATAIGYLKRAVAIAPQDFRNTESLGDKLMEQGQYAAAGTAYRSAIQSLQDSRFGLTKPWLEDAQGKLTVATGAGILARHKRNAQGWLTIGKGLLKQNRQEEAVQAFINALALRPGYTDAELYRFRMALQSSDWKAIYAHQGNIANLSGGNATAASLLGQYQMRTRQYNAAIQTLHHAIALNSHAPDAYDLLAQTYLRRAEQLAAKPGARAAKQAENLKAQALGSLRRGVANMTATTDRHRLSLQLAQLLLKFNKPAEALQLANDVLAENPLNGKAAYLKGKAQFYNGNNESARIMLENALALNPNDPEMLCQLGHIAKEEGRDALAVDYYQRAYKADPLSEEAGTAYRDLLTQLQIVGQKPPEFWYLSDDEHDYMVQLLYQARQIKVNTRDYLRGLAELPGAAGQVDFNLNGIKALQAFQPFVGRLYQSELAGYQRLQAIIVPGRFSGLHYDVSKVAETHLHIFEGVSQQIPSLQGASAHTKVFNHMLESIAATDQALGQQISLIASKLPEPMFKGLLYEAQLSDMADLNREIASLSGTLVSQKPKQQAKKAAPAQQMTPDQLNKLMNQAQQSQQAQGPAAKP